MRKFSALQSFDFAQLPDEEKEKFLLEIATSSSNSSELQWIFNEALPSISRNFGNTYDLCEALLVNLNTPSDVVDALSNRRNFIFDAMAHPNISPERLRQLSTDTTWDARIDTKGFPTVTYMAQQELKRRGL